MSKVSFRSFEDLECSSASVVKEGGGDHYPVRAVLNIDSLSHAKAQSR